MRRITLILFMMVLFCTVQSNAQGSGYDKGNILFNAGFSFGYYGNYYGNNLGYNYSGFVPVTLNLEFSLSDKFSIGPYLAYYSRVYRDNNNRDFYRYTGFNFGGRVSLHLTGIINEAFGANMNENKLDLYASAILGIRTQTQKWGDNWTNNNNRTYSDITFGPLLGVRYFFTPKFGAYFEGGYGTFGIGTLGLSLKF